MENEEFDAKEPEMPDFEIENSKDNDEIDIYTEEGMEAYVEEDEISPSEEGFMMGYLNA